MEVYLIPSSVEEALGYLEKYSGDARVIAGGTDLMIQIRRGELQTRALVDITHIPELKGISQRDGYIVIGAATTHTEIAESPLVWEKAKVLAQACKSIGSLQIRNVGTIGGNLVNAMPAADSAIALAALDAEIEVVSSEGNRWLPLSEFHLGVGKCRVDATRELVRAVRFKALGQSEGSAFKRLARRRALILPILNVGVVVAWDGGRFTRAAIAIGPVAPVPFRSRKAEEALIGSPVSGEALEMAARVAFDEAHPRSSLLRGSAEYRREMVRVLVRRALEEAVERAR